MQEIYAGAERVVIWLGEARFGSDMAIAFIKQLCEKLEKLGIRSEESQDVTQYAEKDFQDGLDGFLGPLFEEKWEAVALLLQRRWWERVWVVQELATARNAVCYCGKTSIAWPLLSLVIQLLGTCKMRITLFPHQFRTSGALDRAWGMVQIRQLASRGHMDLLSLLYRTRYRTCLNPRDKIYSILGMTNERTRLKLRPDYIKSVAEVFIMAVANDMEIHGDLEMLNFIDHDTMQLTYPSWVADWGRGIGRGPRTWRFTKYVPASAPYKSASFSPITFSDDLQLLHTDGFRIDVVEVDNVQQTVEPFQRNTTAGSDNWTWNIDTMTSSLLKEKGIRSRKRLKHVSSSEDLRRSVEEAIYDVMIAGQLSTSSGWEAHQVRYADDQAAQETTRPIDSETMPSQLSSQPAGGTASLSWNLRHLGRAPQCLTLDREQFAASSDLDQDRNRPIDWKIMLSHAKGQTIGRTLVLSKNRYLGLAPKLSKPGDHIFILFGLSEPAILRPQADGSYIFIGTAYVHGVMKGEALKDLEEGIFTRERLTIR